jgi:hypothetical protein
MRIRTRIFGVIGLASLLLVVAGVTNNRAGAQSPRAAIEIGAYGMIGITSGQTARLNVYLPPGPPSRQIPPGPPTRAQLSLMDANGNLAVPSLCDPRSIDCLGGSQTTVMLAPGQSAFLDVSGDQLIGALSRAEIRPVVNVIPPGPPGVPAKTIITTFEVIDNATNKTVILYHPPGPCGEARVND